MGRRPRPVQFYRRKRAIREPYDVALIVCEGEKTEPGYFEGLKKAHRLGSANIKVVSGEGSDPVSIVKHALREYQRGGYDRAYCVFDRDGHASKYGFCFTLTLKPHRSQFLVVDQLVTM